MIIVTQNKCKLSSPPFTVKELRAANGERYSILINSSDGMPLFMPTIYCTSMLRGSCKASNTIKANLSALKILYSWAASNKINVEQRFRSGEYLNLKEIDSISRIVRLPFTEINSEASDSNQESPRKNIFFIENARTTAPKSAQSQVKSGTAAVRIGYICDYLDWLAIYYIGNFPPAQRIDINNSRELMINCIKARKPSSRVHSELGKREGLNHGNKQLLLKSLKPASSQNPWSDHGLQVRNELIIAMLTGLGVRRGELLGITIDKIEIQSRRLTIIRNADDPTDPRAYEPNTKTKDRVLELSPGMLEMILEYVTKIRTKIKGAGKHKFLFVAHNSGKPLSLSAFTKVFRTLRNRIPELPKDLSAHVLRHTWNDCFSELCDQDGTRESDEVKIRSYLMGWSETSGTATTYTRRSTRERSKKMSIKLQHQIKKTME